jgi:hypothetical protein
LRVPPVEKNGGTGWNKPEKAHPDTSEVFHLFHHEELEGGTLEPAQLQGVPPVPPVPPKNSDVCKIRNEKEFLPLAHEAETSCIWYVEFPDRDPVEAHYTHEESRETVAQTHPDAVAFVPIHPRQQQPFPIPSDEQAAILQWLAHIGETDTAIIAETLDKCSRDAEARQYFVGRARAEVPALIENNA